MPNPMSSNRISESLVVIPYDARTKQTVIPKTQDAYDWRAGGRGSVLSALMSGSPGRTLNHVYESCSNFMEAKANRAAHRLGLGPHAVAKKIKSYFGNGEERVQRLQLTRSSNPVELEKFCLCLLKYTQPTESANNQRGAFENIVDLVTLFPGLRQILLRAQCVEGAISTESISALWDRADEPMDDEWTFWQQMAATCLSETLISATLDQSSIPELVNCPVGGLGSIEWLMIQHDCSTSTFSSFLCIRYLGGILDLPGFWLEMGNKVHSDVVRKLCGKMVWVLKDIGVDIHSPELVFPCDSETPFDYGGLDFLANAILVGISGFRKNLDPKNWLVQPWPRSVELLPTSSAYACNNFGDILPIIHRSTVAVVVGNEDLSSDSPADHFVDCNCKSDCKCTAHTAGSLEDSESKNDDKRSRSPTSFTSFQRYFSTDRPFSVTEELGADDEVLAASSFSPGLPVSAVELDGEGQVVGGFILGPIIAQGGFSVIRRATSTSSGAIVTVQCFPKQRWRNTAWRITHREAIWTSLSHEHILTLFACIHTPTTAFFVTQLCPAGSLLDIVHSGVPGRVDAGRIFRQIVRGLRYLHIEKRLVHRDMKLENVLVDEAGVCRIAGFSMTCAMDPPREEPLPTGEGISIPSGSGLNIQHATLRDFQPSSLPYAAPENLSHLRSLADKITGHAGKASAPVTTSAHRKHPAPAQDIWALGVLLYALLMGRLPFMDPFEPRLVLKILDGTYPPPSIVNVGTLAVLRGCLAARVQDRWCIESVDEAAWCFGDEDPSHDRDSGPRPSSRPPVDSLPPLVGFAATGLGRMSEKVQWAAREARHLVLERRRA
ncbi:CAMK/CAMK-unique protein kinase [Mycena venus]|uniref:CAMK/CAMK-unique protein kinase n=1 Tax=Mycena venus TaxID=2733690 RepID=A0A8H7D837_9AGAR|nr:CAMK/CAMK-unique protein kinase [Mycena venus]